MLNMFYTGAEIHNFQTVTKEPVYNIHFVDMYIAWTLTQLLWLILFQRVHYKITKIYFTILVCVTHGNSQGRFDSEPCTFAVAAHYTDIKA